jgi:hypothetical protein
MTFDSLENNQLWYFYFFPFPFQHFLVHSQCGCLQVLEDYYSGIFTFYQVHDSACRTAHSDLFFLVQLPTFHFTLDYYTGTFLHTCIAGSTFLLTLWLKLV